MDVADCFNSIPQQKMLQLAKSLLGSKEYAAAYWTEFPNPTRCNFNSIANVLGGFDEFATSLTDGTRPRKGGRHAVFVDGVTQSRRYRSAILTQLEEHITNNIVKIGKKYYRQRDGIPQGSIMSTMLCSFFYGDFERRHLDFLRRDDCVLLRMIDDFLLITTERGAAQNFLEVMLAGSEEYGIRVKEEKTLCNFHSEVNGIEIKALPAESWFPYCGLVVHTSTLDIRKRGTSVGDERVANAITLSWSDMPGGKLRRSILDNLRRQMFAMLVDTNHNSISSVVSNMLEALRAEAAKCVQAAKRLGMSDAKLPFLIGE